MKSPLTFLFVFIVLQSAIAQELKMCGYQGYQTVEEVTSACDLQGTTTSINDTREATVVVDNILDKVGLFRNFLIEECDNINNALAVTMPLEGGSIDRYILYDEAFFTRVSASTGTDWGLTSILAHEVGHHLNGHTLMGGGSNHKVELQADEFSGFVLARMGCSLADAQSAVSKLLPDEASATHPAKQDRLNAIEVGWNRGNGKTIMVKKIEEVEDPTLITAEQVIANYLEAIGGQEKIREIKTLFRNYSHTSKNIDSKVIEAKTDIEELLATPSKIYCKKKSIVPVEYTVFLLGLNNKAYLKSDSKSPWVLAEGINNSANDEEDISYIPEFGDLTNKHNMKYVGLKKIDDKDCYVIEYPIKEFQKNDYSVIEEQKTKYYEASTGLLYYEETRMNIKPKNNSLETNITSKNIYSDYRSVNGVLFSFKQDATTLVATGTAKYTATSVVELSEIKVNPTINPEDFDPTR
ncbi:MAG: hypothetical protein JJE55_11565 [Flavobacteriaceae bacterium]|nr:hypothetical protein [Flavobacteriaceae bacterium]